uniref:Uncharacterized protein n=1 Tax=Setaria viridis TaxID=4556 RepID=A0A4U6U8Y7_SETVI|nr:hypothetical protein SEVIR_7G259300v2 [Setaria viridis]
MGTNHVAPGDMSVSGTAASPDGVGRDPASAGPPPLPSRTAAPGAAVPSPPSHLCAPGVAAPPPSTPRPICSPRAAPSLQRRLSPLPAPALPRLLSGADAETPPAGGISERAAQVAESCPRRYDVFRWHHASGLGLGSSARGLARFARSTSPTCKFF